ncbi:MAG: hypothetical protein GY845_24095 [Planctomycetes bacterium]|nr:hypothetical protein [Planctomycetota bacterium]
MLFIIGGIVGIVGGFSSFSRGRIFRRTLAGQCIPAIALFAEIGLGLYGWYHRSFLIGLAVFLFSWLIAGNLGMRLAKL